MPAIHIALVYEFISLTEHYNLAIMNATNTMLRCCVCNAPVHTETSEGYICSRLHRAFCGVKCEDEFDPKIHGCHNETQITRSRQQKLKGEEELREALEFLRRGAEPDFLETIDEPLELAIPDDYFGNLKELLKKDYGVTII